VLLGMTAVDRMDLEVAPADDSPGRVDDLSLRVGDHDVIAVVVAGLAMIVSIDIEDVAIDTIEGSGSTEPRDAEQHLRGTGVAAVAAAHQLVDVTPERPAVPERMGPVSVDRSILPRVGLPAEGISLR
jgi:hypothetical protein